MALGSHFDGCVMLLSNHSKGPLNGWPGYLNEHSGSQTGDQPGPVARLLNRLLGTQRGKSISGADSRAARFGVLFVWLTGVAQQIVLWPSFQYPALIVVALMVTLAAVISLSWTTPDPLPLLQTSIVALAPAVSAVAILVQLAPGETNRSWLIEIGSYLCALAVVRGRFILPFAGITVVIAATCIWSQSVGASTEDVARIVSLPIAAVTVGVVWLTMLRRTFARITAHRQEAANSARAEIAAGLAVQLRQRELANIAELAEPLLLRITEGADFSATDRTAAMLLEAEIRDRLRAQRLAVAALVKVCRAARVRGVVVLLLDDGGPFAPAIADTVVDVIIRAVSGAVRGRVTVRLEPAGRERLGTILLDDGLISERIDL